MPVETLREAGASVGLGLDDAYWHDSFDMFAEAKHARLFANHYNGTPSLETRELLEMMTGEGADAMGIGEQVGRLVEGQRADITVVDAEKSWMRPGTNLPARLINTVSNRDVTSVMVDGEFLMRDGDVKTLNESEVVDEARAALERLEEETTWSLSRRGPIRRRPKRSGTCQRPAPCACSPGLAGKR